jgi:hypothetical protein
VCEPLLAPDLGAAAWWARWEQAQGLAPEVRAPLLRALRRAARPCWRGERAQITRADFLEEVARGGPLPEGAARLLADL